MYPLFLIGFMGSGKSTIGKELSRKYPLSFIDTDTYIESKYGMEITNIFEKFGEETFRKYEHEALKEVLSKNIIATGGGIVERKENIQLMTQKGTIIYLHTTFAEIDRRLKEDESRPLWINSDLSEKQALYNHRDKLYQKCAHHVVQTDGCTINDVVEDIVHKLSLNKA